MAFPVGSNENAGFRNKGESSVNEEIRGICLPHGGQDDTRA